MPISAGTGKILQILVENQGRINFQIANDFKGIIGDVLLNQSPLYNWNITGFPFENATKLDELIAFGDRESDTNRSQSRTSEELQSGPLIFHGTFDINQDEIVDTYINPMGWGKVEYFCRFNDF